MNIFDLPEDTDEDIGDDLIIAEQNPGNWQRLADEFNRVIDDVRAGRLRFAVENNNRGIIGPQTDGCIRADIELLLVPVPPKSPSFRRRTHR